MDVRESERRLVNRAREGDHDARAALLLSRHRALKRMIHFRLHPRLKRRLDDSDVFQEVMVEASRCLDEYLQHPPVPVQVWLRQITGRKLLDLHRRHLGAQRRDAAREVSLWDQSTPHSGSAAGSCRPASGITPPSQFAVRAELRRLVQTALDELAPIDREILVLRHFEQLSNAEAAAALGIHASACSNRYLRALGHLRQHLAGISGSLGSCASGG